MIRWDFVGGGGGGFILGDFIHCYKVGGGGGGAFVRGICPDTLLPWEHIISF